MDRKVLECEDVCSLYLRPHDGKPLPPFKPGQYLTFNVQIPDRSKPLIRCYSLSEGPGRADYYRVTIKRCPPPPGMPGAAPGVVSSYLLDAVGQGDILDVRAPTGSFYLNPERDMPVVLISGGVGVTPMVSMVEALIGSGSQREVWFFHGTRNRLDHILKETVEELAEKHSNINCNYPGG